MTAVQLNEYADVDIETVDAASLVDAAQIENNTNKPLSERIAEIIWQIRNPYCFKCGKVVVKVGFNDTHITMEKRMESYFRFLYA